MKPSFQLNSFTTFALTMAGLAILSLSSPAATRFGAADLRCEYKRNPLAVGELQPRLSWVVETGQNERGIAQAAYHLLVASSAELLKKDQGDLWDTGKVASDQSTQLVYAGKPLASRQACFWKVKLWDQSGRASAWSQPAAWGMGLLAPADWHAKWLGYEPPAEGGDASAAALKQLLRLDDAKWLWANGAQPGDQPPGKLYFRKVLELPANRQLKQATFLLAADDAFQLFVNGHPSGQGTTWQKASSLDITGRLQPGANALGIEVTNGGDKPTAAGLIGRLVILFADGQTMVVPVDTSWQTSREPGQRWNLADFDASGWKPATEIAAFGASPWGKIETTTVPMEPAPFFRKSFTLSKPVKRAIAYASALGVYELHVNGSTVDKDVLSPGWTDYHKRVHYLAYDVTARLNRGENVMGAILGDGWYAGFLAFTGKRHYYGEHTRFIAQLEVEFQDGTRQTIATDDSWKATTGPIREGDLLMGCVYDARKELPGWDTPACDDSAWHSATVAGRDANVSDALHGVPDQPQAHLEVHPGEPIRREQELPARKLTEPKPGVYVFDLGQNIVGWVRLKAKGDPGQKVTVRHAEMLNPDGTIYTTNLRAARAVDTYFLAGRDKRAYEPYFTFHGFQYVEVTGLNYKPELADVMGIVVHSDLPRAGWFECSEPLVNKLTLNSLWGQKGNFLDVPTDCPQRDERAGWTGDAQVFMKTACLNLDSPAFYTKWLTDLCTDSQRADGGFGDVAPHLGIVGFGNTGWSDAGPVCCWRMYEMYGDTRILERHWDALVRHSDYLAKTSKQLLRGTLAYGDWLRLAGPQHSEVIGTAYYYYTTTLMTRIAEVLGKTDEAAKYRGLAAQIREAFLKNFLQPDGRLVDAKKETGQTFYALAFGLGLVPDEMKERAAAQFVAAINKENDHLATGFLGTPFVLFALQKAGHPELAYKLVLNRTYPSWLQQVLWGSTTMWERWDGWRPDKGFQDPGMNSFNHYWLGCVSEWLFTQAAGLDTDGPAYKRITIRPEIVPVGVGFSRVKAVYNSIRGPVGAEWSLEKGRFDLQVTVPGNCVATVFVPARDAATVTESGKPAMRSAGVTFLRREGAAAVYQIGSGRYNFRSADPL